MQHKFHNKESQKWFQKFNKGKNGGPLSIAHRGLSSLFPQNTIESIEASFHYSDLTELDILLTKDHQIVVFHDRYLSKLTNIDQFPEFQNRKRDAQYDVQQGQTVRNDWWLIDFTLQQIKKLNVYQKSQCRPQLRNLQFKIPTLQELFIFITSKNKQNININKNCGLLIELKSQWQYIDSNQDQVLVQKLISLLNKYNLNSIQTCIQRQIPIAIQTFSPYIVKRIIQMPIYLPYFYLLVKQNFPVNGIQSIISEKLIGIGITQPQATLSLKKQCEKYKLLMYYWTLKDDQIKIPFNKNTWQQVYFHLLNLQINGFITEFPQKVNLYWKLKKSN